MAHALIIETPVLDGILDAWREQLGADFTPYRNHCCRVLNYMMAFEPADPDALEKTSIALGFHDLGIWSHRTFAYLEPSADLARSYLDESGHADWADEISDMIEWHHKFTACADNVAGSLVEPFRKADSVDVSLGLRRFGLSRALIAEVKRAFPNSGFHRKLVRLTLSRLRSHPLNPLPMMRW